MVESKHWLVFSYPVVIFMDKIFRYILVYCPQMGVRSVLCNSHSRNIDFVVLKPLCDYYGGMLRVTVHLEDPFDQ